ncbi:MAG TPA: ELM1/GtrOC1 family putative glycosyltransferase [Sphingomicrobium sp.]|nr:ELM1/GtrOC1 family putative glycosyltransferase [Sphingomicrobium sp.]
MAEKAPVWVLLGQRTGDNNQLLRLANELGEPFRTIELGYNSVSRIPPRLLGTTFASIDEGSRARIGPPWPALVLGIGNRSVPAALAIRRLSGGEAKLVRLGRPRLDPRNFDLVITTPQYGVPDAPNVIRLAVGIGTAQRLESNRVETEWLGKLPRPHRLFLIGGNTFMWALSPQTLADTATALKRKCESDGGSVIAVSSPRSSQPVLDSVAAVLRGSVHGLVWGGFPRYPVLLEDADELYVTADSVAMISDAVATGKPIGLIAPEETSSGRFFYGLARLGLPVPVRDIRRFWESVRSKGLAGTVEEPVAGELSRDPLATAVAAVRSLLKN